MTKPIEGWLTTKAAAELTGYNIKYLRHLLKLGLIEACKIGRDWLVNKDDLLSYKAEMDRLGTQKHSPWREDLAEKTRGRSKNSKQQEQR